MPPKLLFPWTSLLNVSDNMTRNGTYTGSLGLPCQMVVNVWRKYIQVERIDQRLQFINSRPQPSVNSHTRLHHTDNINKHQTPPLVQHCPLVSYSNTRNSYSDCDINTAAIQITTTTTITIITTTPI